MRNNKIGERLRTLRGNKTRGEVATALKLSISAIKMYESNLRVPQDDIKIRIAKYFDKSVQELFFE